MKLTDPNADDSPLNVASVWSAGSSVPLTQGHGVVRRHRVDVVAQFELLFTRKFCLPEMCLLSVHLCLPA